MSDELKQVGDPGIDITEFFPVLAHEVYRLSELLKISLSSLASEHPDRDADILPATSISLISTAQRTAARLFYLSELALMASKSSHHTFSPKTMRFNIKKSVAEVIAELQIAYPRSQERIKFQASSQLSIEADPVLIEFALSNMLENAIKYGTGNIDLYIEEGIDPLIFISPYTLIKVENDAHSEHLAGSNSSEFSSQRISWGVGLDLLKQIAQAHQGKFEFKRGEISAMGDVAGCRRVSSRMYLPRD